MTVFTQSVTSLQLPHKIRTTSIFSWLKAQLDARRKRRMERDEIHRLRKFDSYLLADAGVDQALLFSAIARIGAAHESLLVSDERRQTGR